MIGNAMSHPEYPCVLWTPVMLSARSLASTGDSVILVVLAIAVRFHTLFHVSLIGFCGIIPVVPLGDGSSTSVSYSLHHLPLLECHGTLP